MTWSFLEIPRLWLLSRAVEKLKAASAQCGWVKGQRMMYCVWHRVFSVSVLEWWHSQIGATHAGHKSTREKFCLCRFYVGISFPALCCMDLAKILTTLICCYKLCNNLDLLVHHFDTFTADISMQKLKKKTLIGTSEASNILPFISHVDILILEF